MHCARAAGRLRRRRAPGSRCRRQVGSASCGGPVGDLVLALWGAALALCVTAGCYVWAAALPNLPRRSARWLPVVVKLGCSRSGQGGLHAPFIHASGHKPTPWPPWPAASGRPGPHCTHARHRGCQQHLYTQSHAAVTWAAICTKLHVSQRPVCTLCIPTYPDRATTQSYCMPTNYSNSADCYAAQHSTGGECGAWRQQHTT